MDNKARFIDEICKLRRQLIERLKTFDAVLDEYEKRLTSYVDPRDVSNAFYAWLQYQIAEDRGKLDALDRQIFGEEGRAACTISA